MALVDVYSQGQKIAGLPIFKGDKGDSLKYEDLTTEQKAELRGTAIEVKTQSQYAALTPTEGVLYIVIADS